MTDVVRRIVPQSRWLDFGLQELWRHRELLFWLGWRDLRVRYQQTVAGAFWVVVQPLAMMAVFSVTLGFLARVASNDLPYAVLVLSGLVPWTLFSSILSSASSSLVSNASLVTKVYFPRNVLVFSALLAPLVDFAVSLVILLVILAIFGVVPAWTVVLLPFFGILVAVTALGPSLWFATLNVRYRDVRFMIPFLLQVGLFASPIVYPIDLVPPQYLTIYSLNPAVFVIQEFRHLLFGTGLVTTAMFVSWLVFTTVTIVSGLLYLRAEEKFFADMI